MNSEEEAVKRQLEQALPEKIDSLNYLAKQIAVVIEKINNNDKLLTSIKEDFRSDFKSANEKLDKLNESYARIEQRVAQLEEENDKLREEVDILMKRQEMIETRYNTIINLFKIGLPCAVAAVSLISGLVYLFKYLL